MTEVVFKLEPSLDREVFIEPIGWKRLKIEYSTEVFNGVSYICWRIADTEKVFQVAARIVYEQHGLDFSQHFVLTLNMFAEDFKSWEELGFPEPWMQSYQTQYRNFLL